MISMDSASSSGTPPDGPELAEGSAKGATGEAPRRRFGVGASLGDLDLSVVEVETGAEGSRWWSISRFERLVRRYVVGGGLPGQRT